MAEPLKNFFDRDLVRSLSDDLSRVYPQFAASAFVRDCLRGFEPLSLTQRAGRIAELLRRELPPEYPEALSCLLASLGPKLTSSDAFAMSSFRYLPHVMFVGRYGLDHFEPSMAAQRELTQRFTAEFSIRPFLERYPELTLARLAEWTRDPSEHVRRLVSEGTRPRLPWAGRLRAFLLDPSPVLVLLEQLKDDSSRYVQRSVANNLNDIAKDHPERVLEVCRRWKEGASPARAYIVGHAVRSLVKQGHPEALALLGASEKPQVELAVLELPGRVRRGDAFRLSLTITSKARRTQTLIVDYALHYVKANGKRSPKVFKLKKLELAPRESVRLQTTISFVERTTRKHYPGRHRLELLVNGVSFELGEFELA